jgi:hypothetical protein
MLDRVEPQIATMVSMDSKFATAMAMFFSSAMREATLA